MKMIKDFFEKQITKKLIQIDKQKSLRFSYRYRSEQLKDIILDLITDK